MLLPFSGYLLVRVVTTFLPAAWPLTGVGYGLLPIRPFHMTWWNLAVGTWSASAKSKPAVTLSQYAALCLGLMFGPAANFVLLTPCARFSDVVFRTVDATAE